MNPFFASLDAISKAAAESIDREIMANIDYFPLIQLIERITEEHRLAHGDEKLYLQGKKDGLRIALALLFEDVRERESTATLIESSRFAQTYDDFIAEQLTKDGIRKFTTE